jgi:hypothetical protein
LLAKPFVLSLSKHEQFGAVKSGFSRPSFDKLRTNGKILANQNTEVICDQSTYA